MLIAYHHTTWPTKRVLFSKLKRWSPSGETILGASLRSASILNGWTQGRHAEYWIGYGEQQGVLPVVLCSPRSSFRLSQIKRSSSHRRLTPTSLTKEIATVSVSFRSLVLRPFAFIRTTIPLVGPGWSIRILRSGIRILRLRLLLEERLKQFCQCFGWLGRLRSGFVRRRGCGGSCPYTCCRRFGNGVQDFIDDVIWKCLDFRLWCVLLDQKSFDQRPCR